MLPRHFQAAAPARQEPHGQRTAWTRPVVGRRLALRARLPVRHTCRGRWAGRICSAEWMSVCQAHLAGHPCYERRPALRCWASRPPAARRAPERIRSFQAVAPANWGMRWRRTGWIRSAGRKPVLRMYPAAGHEDLGPRSPAVQRFERRRPQAGRHWRVSAPAARRREVYGRSVSCWSQPPFVFSFQ